MPQSSIDKCSCMVYVRKFLQYHNQRYGNDNVDDRSYETALLKGQNCRPRGILTIKRNHAIKTKTLILYSYMNRVTT